MPGKVSVTTTGGKPPVKRKKPSPFASKSNVISFGIVGSLVISAFFFFALIRPQWNKISVGGEYNLNSSQAQLDEKHQKLKEVKKLLDNLDTINTDQIELLSMVLPAEKAVPELLSQLEVMAQQSGVSLANVQLSEKAEARSAAERQKQAQAAKKNKDIKELVVQVDVTAFSYLSFRTFIDALQANSRILDIEQFTFTSDQEQQSILLKTYYLDSK